MNENCRNYVIDKPRNSIARKSFHEGLQFLALCRQRGCAPFRRERKGAQMNDHVVIEYNGELTMDEIGQIYGISKMAVSKRLKKFHEKLGRSVL